MLLKKVMTLIQTAVRQSVCTAASIYKPTALPSVLLSPSFSHSVPHLASRQRIPASASLHPHCDLQRAQIQPGAGCSSLARDDSVAHAGPPRICRHHAPRGRIGPGWWSGDGGGARERGRGHGGGLSCLAMRGFSCSGAAAQCHSSNLCAATLLVLSPPSNAALPASTILPPPPHAASILPPPLRVLIHTFESTPMPTKEQESSPAAVRPRSRHHTLRWGSRSRSSGGDPARRETSYASGTAVASST